MVSSLCFNCFNVKGKSVVCPHCGYADGTPPKEPYHLLPGTRLYNGRYIRGMSIGAGGFGIIYKAYDMALGVVTAVKEFYPAGLVNRAPGTVTPGLLSGDKKEVFQQNKYEFLMEAQIISSLGNTDDIVNVYNCFEENGTAYIVMEYMEGILLKDLLKQRGRLRPEEALAAALRVIEAVRKVHAKNVIHRDISPDNIFCTKDGIKLFDFGAAQVLGKQEAVPGNAVVKPGYTPPEQYQQKGKQGFYTDIYTIGALLYEMLTGIEPAEASERIVRDRLKKPGELGIQLDPNLDRTVMKAMAVDPAYRFANVEELKEALCSRRAAEYPEVERRNKRRKRNLAAAGAFVFLLAAVAGIVFFAGRRQSGPLHVKLKEDTMAVWIPVERQPDSGILKLDKENADDQDFSREWKDYKKQYRFYDAAETACEFLTDEEFPNNKNITIELVPVLEEEYESAYEAAAEADTDAYSQPVLFMTEGLGNASHDGYADLTPVYQSLDMDDYYFLPEYEELFADARQAPAGFDTLFLYWRGKVNRKDTELKLPEGTTADINDDLLEPVRKKRVKKLEDYVGWDDRLLADTLYLLDDSMADDGKAVFSQELISCTELMYRMQSKVKKSHGAMEEWFDSYKSRLAGIISDSTLLRSKTITAAKGNYEVRLLSCEGRLLAVCRDVYAVNAYAGKNQQNAAMRLLVYMLTQNAQSLNYQQHKRALPLQRDVFQTYMDSEKQLSEVLKLPVKELGTDYDTMEKQGEDHQLVYRCGRDLNRDIFDRKNMAAEEITQYLENYK